jgi:hypothetical protein
MGIVMSIKDYGESIIKIQKLQREAHDALNEKDWARVCDMADEIILAARSIRMHCISAMEEA